MENFTYEINLNRSVKGSEVKRIGKFVEKMPLEYIPIDAFIDLCQNVYPHPSGLSRFLVNYMQGHAKKKETEYYNVQDWVELGEHVKIKLYHLVLQLMFTDSQKNCTQLKFLCLVKYFRGSCGFNFHLESKLGYSVTYKTLQNL